MSPAVFGELPDFPPVWRAALMGVNVTVEAAAGVLEALDAILARVPAGTRAAVF